MTQPLNILKSLLDSRDIHVLGSNAEPLFKQSDVLRYIDVDQTQQFSD